MDADEASILADDIEAIEHQTCTIDGTDYACRFTPFDRRDKIEIGGYVQEWDASIWLRRELFDTLPTNVQQITVDGREFQIVGRHEPEIGQIDIELKLAHTN